MNAPGETPLYKDLTEEIIGSAMEVYREIGPGLNEDWYENGLCIEFALRKKHFSQQSIFPVSYKGHPVGKLIPDLIAEDKVIVENKVVEKIVEAHIAQLLSYLAITGLQVGLIFNYKHPSLQVRRVIRRHHP